MLNKIAKQIKGYIKYLYNRIRYRNIIRGIRKNGHEDSFLASDKMTYEVLSFLSQYNYSLWKNAREAVIGDNKKRLAKQDKIHLGFICNYDDTWSCDTLYKMFSNSNRFEPCIYVSRFFNANADNIDETYYRAIRYFKNKRYVIKNSTDFRNEIARDKIDILVYLTPYTFALEDCFRLRNIPLKIITTLVPYGIYVADLETAQYNLLDYSMFIYIYDLSYYCKEATKKASIRNTNRIPSGYCKLDPLYDDGNKCYKGWKGNANNFRIILAPHHSIKNRQQMFSSFDKYYIDMLRLAETTTEEFSWIIKPHPLLKESCLEEGLFQDGIAFDDYIGCWDNLKNGNSLIGGGYLDLFKSSDVIVLDSDSFLAEYLYTGKPIILLTRDTQKMSELGKLLYPAYYKIPGDDIRDLKKLLISLKNGYDPLGKNRREIYKKYLDYKAQNGVLASEYIYDHLLITSGDVCDKEN